MHKLMNDCLHNGRRKLPDRIGRDACASAFGSNPVTHRRTDDGPGRRMLPVSG